MPFGKLHIAALVACAVFCLSHSLPQAAAQSPGSSQRGSSSSNPVPQEKAPSLVDPAGPTISLVPSEPVFLMASALNACGYDEGLDESAPAAQARARRDEPGPGEE